VIKCLLRFGQSVVLVHGAHPASGGKKLVHILLEDCIEYYTMQK